MLCNDLLFLSVCATSPIPASAVADALFTWVNESGAMAADADGAQAKARRRIEARMHILLAPADAAAAAMEDGMV